MPTDQHGTAVPPSNEDAEQALLGSAFLDREVPGRVSLIVQEDDFWNPRCRILYGIMLALYERGEPIDPITLSEEYQKRKIEVDSYWLFSLMGTVPTPIHAESYARLIADAALKRRLVTAGGRIAAMGFADDVPAAEGVERAELVLAEVSAGRKPLSFQRADEAMAAYLEEQAAIVGGEGALTDYRIPTGYPMLDRALRGGLGRADLTILAARPSMGKSSLAIGMAVNAAARFDAGVAFFSLEMSARQVAGRMVSTEGRVSMDALVRGGASPDQERRAGRAMATIASAPIWIDETAGLTVTEIRTRARQLSRTQKIDLIVVDHIQLVYSSNPRDTMVARMTEVSVKLKVLARELNVPVLALAQLSREVDRRKPPIPMLSDLRESGTIEQDADNVLFIYREDYYDRDSERQGSADIIVGKQRNGETGRVQMWWDAPTASFRDLEAYMPERQQ